MQTIKFADRIVSLMGCCFLIILSFSVGLIFSFNIWVLLMVFGVYLACINFTLYKLNLDSPPGVFFYAMLLSLAVCIPFDRTLIPEKVGFVTLGALFTFLVGFFYALMTHRKIKVFAIEVFSSKRQWFKMLQSIMIGLFSMLSLGFAFYFDLSYPYWVPISCCAVMMGRSTRHVFLRSAHRLFGTMIGIVVTWGITIFHPSLLLIAIYIIIAQIFIEYLVVRNYGLANIFITILTILFAEKGYDLQMDASSFILSRLVDILIGSLFGIIGGSILYNWSFRYSWLKINRYLRDKINVKRAIAKGYYE